MRFGEQVNRSRHIVSQKNNGNIIVKQGCQLSRIWRDFHAFDLLLTQFTKLLTHLKIITHILTQFEKVKINLLFLISIENIGFQKKTMLIIVFFLHDG